MSLYYLDSSALVKHYVTEPGTRWIQALSDPSAGNTIITTGISRVEVSAAIAARYRAPKGLSLAERDGAIELLKQHCISNYSLISVDTAVLDRALALTQQHRLRGYDAVQLATALIVSALYKTVGLSALIFVAADRDLLATAQAEGLVVDDPNTHL